MFILVKHRPLRVTSGKLRALQRFHCFPEVQPELTLINASMSLFTIPFIVTFICILSSMALDNCGLVEFFLFCIFTTVYLPSAEVRAAAHFIVLLFCCATAVAALDNLWAGSTFSRWDLKLQESFVLPMRLIDDPGEAVEVR